MAKPKIKRYVVPVVFIIDAPSPQVAQASIEGVLSCADEAEINVWTSWGVVENAETLPVGVSEAPVH